MGNSTQYIIPIYQRPYSWSAKQTRKFIADIFVSFWGYNKDSSSEPMFIGIMQLSQKDNKGEQNIIDGQQRITTFLILLKVLSIRNKNSTELADFDFKWLQTKVNNGKQQVNLIELINSTPQIGKEVFKLTRSEVLMDIYKLDLSLPISLNNLLYLINAIYIKNEEINNLTPSLISEYIE